MPPYTPPYAAALLILILSTSGAAATAAYSSKLIHRFSDEARARLGGQEGDTWTTPEKKKGSLEYYKVLVRSDVERQKMRVGPHFQFVVPSQGGYSFSFGNDWGWLHYTWIDIGTPNVSFLVALDAGSDLLWVPCDCVQCAPLSSASYNSLVLESKIEEKEVKSRFNLPFHFYLNDQESDLIAESVCSLVCGASILQGRDLNQYNPTLSSTSKHLSCSHQFCELGPKCKSPQQQCPYSVDYFSEDTSSSGFLVEDTMHFLAGSDGASNISAKAPVIVGCGRKQSGSYLDGIAPDGLMGLGLGDVSVPSMLSKAGFVRNSFSLCFDDEGSGRIYFGDQGVVTQKSTPFLPINGKFLTYIVGVEAFCVGSACLDKTSKALVDSGSSFTFLPKEAYDWMVEKFDSEVDASRTSYEGSPWKYCYTFSSTEMPKTPSVALKFGSNNSLIVHDPVLKVYNKEDIVGFCLAIQPTNEDVATIGQNFMSGYRMVFDREDLKLRWSSSNCQYLTDSQGMPLSPGSKSPNPLPTTEQQRAPGQHAIPPAVAGRTPSKPSSASTHHLYSNLANFLLMLYLHLLASCL